MKKCIVFFALFFIAIGAALADEYFLHFTGLAFQGQAKKYPEYGLVFWGDGSPGNDSERNRLICPVNFQLSSGVINGITIRYYDGDPDRAFRIRLMRMSIETGLPEVQAEWNSDLLHDSGWTNAEFLIYKRDIDNSRFSYWIEALLFGPGSFSGGGMKIALQAVRISYLKP